MATLPLYGWTHHDKTGKEVTHGFWLFFSKEECVSWMSQFNKDCMIKLTKMDVPRPSAAAIVRVVCLWTLCRIITETLQEIGQVYHSHREHLSLGWKMSAEKAIDLFLPKDCKKHLLNPSCVADCQTVLQLLGYDQEANKTDQDLKEVLKDVSRERWGQRLLRLSNKAWTPLFQYVRYVLYIRITD